LTTLSRPRNDPRNDPMRGMFAELARPRAWPERFNKGNRMGKSYLPTSQAARLQWVQNFVGYVGTHAASVGLIPAEIADLTLLLSDLETSAAAVLPAQAQASAAVADRDAREDLLLGKVRNAVKKIQANPAVTDPMREAMKINVRKPASDIPAPTAWPVGEPAIKGALTHDVRFEANDTSGRGLPEGASGIELYVAVAAHDAPAPAGPDSAGMEFVGVLSSGKTARTYSAADACKVAYYCACYINGKGEKGPFGPVVGATIAA
jgi:hypothetical protein